MDCKRCKSGFPVLIEGSKGFCSFCGSPLNVVEFKLEGDFGPFYSDETEIVSLRLRLENLGTGEIEIENIEITKV